MEYGWHVVHYTAPTIDIYRVELAGEDPLPPSHYSRLSEVFYDGTESMCRDFLDDLREEIGGDRISARRESLVVSCQWGAYPEATGGLTDRSSEMACKGGFGPLIISTIDSSHT